MEEEVKNVDVWQAKEGLEVSNVSGAKMSTR